MEAQDTSNQEQDVLASEVLDSLGEPKDAANEINESHESDGSGSTDPLYVQKRLKQQKRAHDREIRALHQKLETMQSTRERDNYSQPMQPTNPDMAGSGDIAGHIQTAVNFALQQKEREERKAKEMEAQEHINKQYGELHKHLDGMGDKYDDFDDVVRGDAPFTPHMRDASLLLPTTGSGSAGEVLYKLGKNRSELDRIAKLHPLEQARELNRLSHALAKGSDAKGSEQPRTLGNIKSTPVMNSHAVTDKTPPSEIRARMKAGKFK